MTTAIITTSPARFYAGQVVVDDLANETYEVESQGPKNVRAATAAGQVWRIDARRLRLATDEESEAFRAKKVKTDFFYPGNVVRFTGTSPRTPEGLWVVTKDNGNGYNLVRLGGDTSGRYYRSVPAASIKKVTVADVGTDGFTNV